MTEDRTIYEVSKQEQQFNRILVAIRQNQVFLYPPLATFMLGQEHWSLNPAELSVLSLLSEYGKPVVAEELRISIDMVEHHIASIYKKLEFMKELTIGSLN